MVRGLGDIESSWLLTAELLPHANASPDLLIRKSNIIPFPQHAEQRLRWTK
jgi:hypothetical protein